MTATSNPFDRGAPEAIEYDAWYDDPLGSSVLVRERQCLLPLIRDAGRPWLDLGTGSGRFGAALGVEAGLDPAIEMLRIAARRLPSALLGVATALPVRDASLGAVISVAVFEFLPDAGQAMREIARALSPGGRFVLGFFPRGSAWALAYEAHGRDPASLFHGARFYSLGELGAMAAAAGLSQGHVRSTLFEAPGQPSTDRIVDGADPAAGFMATAMLKPYAGGGQR